MVRIKVCGLTRLEDALAAARLGADALGFVFAPSPRRIEPDLAAAIIRELPPFVLTVGVFVNESLHRIEAVRRRCGLDAVQLHGDEDEAVVVAVRRRTGVRVIKALPAGPGVDISKSVFPGTPLLLDAGSGRVRGGTGQTCDWSLAAAVAAGRTIILAGGLNPDNVSRAVALVKPYAVDVSSGVESEMGRKDHEKLAAFIHRARAVVRPAR
ncbi:MAG: phosphoribosylanthranilate isomerase [Thermodesulfobacteriota bacterium]